MMKIPYFKINEADDGIPSPSEVGAMAPLGAGSSPETNSDQNSPPPPDGEPVAPTSAPEDSSDDSNADDDLNFSFLIINDLSNDWAHKSIHGGGIKTGIEYELNSEMFNNWLKSNNLGNSKDALIKIARGEHEKVDKSILDKFLNAIRSGDVADKMDEVDIELDDDGVPFVAKNSMFYLSY